MDVKFLETKLSVYACVAKNFTSFIWDWRLILSIIGGLLSTAFSSVVALTSAVVISNQVLVWYKKINVFYIKFMANSLDKILHFCTG